MIVTGRDASRPLEQRRKTGRSCTADLWRRPGTGGVLKCPTAVRSPAARLRFAGTALRKAPRPYPSAALPLLQRGEVPFCIAGYRLRVSFLVLDELAAIRRRLILYPLHRVHHALSKARKIAVVRPGRNLSRPALNGVVATRLAANTSAVSHQYYRRRLQDS